MKKIILMGLPDTGKTTFIAALWHVLESDEINSELVLHKYDGDKHYLNAIRDQWIEFNVVGRSKTTDIKLNSIKIKYRGTENVFELIIPDLNGEIFQNQWIDRFWHSDFTSIVQEADTFILFINPTKYQSPDEISDLAIVLNKFIDISEEANSSTNNLKNPYWNPENVPTQVKLVDLIQSVLLKKTDAINLVIVISAWDVIEKQNNIGLHLGPNSWLEKELPLFYQFIYSNEELLNFRIIGVSAQGGDYTDDIDVLNKLIPSERIKVVMPDCTTNDITKCLTLFA